jgi:anti-sigma regulatory factor (Ser/Thr protein kinase)/CBS domain-containing protein
VQGNDSKPGQTTGRITRAEVLAYEIKVGALMAAPRLVIAPQDPASTTLKRMRQLQLSVAPVVESGKLMGMVTPDGLEESDARVKAYVVAPPAPLYPEDLVIKAIQLFSKSKADQLPVITEQGELAGMLSKTDVTGGLLEALASDYQEEEIRRFRASHLFEDIVSDRTSLMLRYRVPARDFAKGGLASACVRQALLRLGADLDTARRCAIGVYEAEMNLVIHTLHGGILRVEVQPHMIFIEALDDGPGIPDVELAMQPGYTTTPEEIRALGFGAGFGLPNIKRCVDKMWLQSTPGEGTRLEMWIYLEPDVAHRTLETYLDRLGQL